MLWRVRCPSGAFRLASIAFLLPNGLEVVLCYYACFILGAIAVPLNIRFPPELIAYVLDHSEARVLISEPELFARIAPIRSERRHVETIYLAGASMLTEVKDFGALLRVAAAPEIDQSWGPDQPAALFYTSGTTGTPKGVIHTHGSLMGAVENQVAEIGITGKDKTLIVLPICYLVAFGSQVLPFHAAGATSVVLPGFEPRQMLAVIHTHRPTNSSGFRRSTTSSPKRLRRVQTTWAAWTSASPRARRWPSPCSSASGRPSALR